MIGSGGTKDVYLIQHELGPVKIGVSKDPQNRLQNLQTGPFELRLIGVLTSPRPELLERALHECFSGQRLRGEWFELGTDDIEEIFSKRHPESGVLACVETGEYVEEYRIPAFDPIPSEYTKIVKPGAKSSQGLADDQDRGDAARRRQTLMWQGLVG